MKNVNKIWKPKTGEWCVFYNNNAESFRVAKFNYIGFGEGKEGKYKDMQGNYFDICEPYLYELPEGFKNVNN